MGMMGDVPMEPDLEASGEITQVKEPKGGEI
jgi:hypothetical protein